MLLLGHTWQGCLSLLLWLLGLDRWGLPMTLLLLSLLRRLSHAGRGLLVLLPL